MLRDQFEGETLREGFDQAALRLILIASEFPDLGQKAGALDEQIDL